MRLSLAAAPRQRRQHSFRSCRSLQLRALRQPLRQRQRRALRLAVRSCCCL
jgi:hypothetical protein